MTLIDEAEELRRFHEVMAAWADEGEPRLDVGHQGLPAVPWPSNMWARVGRDDQ